MGFEKDATDDLWAGVAPVVIEGDGAGDDLLGLVVHVLVGVVKGRAKVDDGVVVHAGEKTAPYRGLVCDEKERLVYLETRSGGLGRERESCTHASETHDILDGEAGKDIVEIDEQRETEEEAGGVAPGVLDETSAGDKGRHKGRQRGKKTGHLRGSRGPCCIYEEEAATFFRKGKV